MDEETAKLVLEELIALRAQMAKMQAELREFLDTPSPLAKWFPKEFAKGDKQNDGREPPK